MIQRALDGFEDKALDSLRNQDEIATTAIAIAGMIPHRALDKMGKHNPNYPVVICALIHLSRAQAEYELGREVGKMQDGIKEALRHV